MFEVQNQSPAITCEEMWNLGDPVAQNLAGVGYIKTTIK